MKGFTRLTLGLISLLLIAGFASGKDYESILKDWSKTQHHAESANVLDLTATLYSAEYIDALSLSEAEKNLWTKDEVEQFKYNILKVSRMDEFIPVELSFKILGSPLHMAPFDRQVELWIGGKAYKPVEYDPRLNFKVEESMTGMVYFPRYDEKGKDLLEGVKHLMLRVSPAISGAIRGTKVEFIWDITNQSGSLLDLLEGDAAKRFEFDRLLKRLENLNKRKSALADELAGVDAEIGNIENRLTELKQ